jgi:hypothetical protein
MIGFTWWINAGLFKRYRPNEIIFLTINEAINDAIKEYPYEYIGIDEVKCEDGYLTTVATIKKCNKCIWIDEEG